MGFVVVFVEEGDVYVEVVVVVECREIDRDLGFVVVGFDVV